MSAVCYISLANKQNENTKDKVEDENKKERVIISAYKLIIMKHHKCPPHVQFSTSMSFQAEVQVRNGYISI